MKGIRSESKVCDRTGACLMCTCENDGNRSRFLWQ